MKGSPSRTEPAKQPKPTPNPTTAVQVKTQAGHGGHAGGATGGRREQERANRPGIRNPALPQQLTSKPKEAMADKQEIEQEAGANKNEQERTQSPKPRKRSPPDKGTGKGWEQGGHCSCNPKSCRAVIEKTGQRAPVGSHKVPARSGAPDSPAEINARRDVCQHPPSHRIVTMSKSGR